MKVEPAPRDIPRGGRRADDRSSVITHRRDGQGDIQQPAFLCPAHRIVRLDNLALEHAVEQSHQLRFPTSRGQDGEV